MEKSRRWNADLVFQHVSAGLGQVVAVKLKASKKGFIAVLHLDRMAEPANIGTARGLFLRRARFCERQGRDADQYGRE
jgi:hypothetical protein